MIKYKFCPKCAGKLKDWLDYYKCIECGYKIFMHSAITASVLPVKGDKVLLSKRKFDPQKGKVDVLGGFLKYGEDPAKGAIREMKEETGVDIEILGLLNVYNDFYYYQDEEIATLNFVYVAKLKDEKIVVSDDVAEVFWQPIFQRPRELAFKLVGRALTELGTWYKVHLK